MAWLEARRKAVARQAETKADRFDHGHRKFFANAEMSPHGGLERGLACGPRGGARKRIVGERARIDFRADVEDFLFIPLVFRQFPIEKSPWVFAAAVQGAFLVAGKGEEISDGAPNFAQMIIVDPVIDDLEEAPIAAGLADLSGDPGRGCWVAHTFRTAKVDDRYGLGDVHAFGDRCEIRVDIVHLVLLRSIS